MTPRRLGAQNFAGGGYLKPLRDRFACFAARNWLRHEARKIDAVTILTTHFVVAAAVSGGRILRPGDEDIGSYTLNVK